MIGSRATTEMASLAFPPTLESSIISELDKEFDGGVDWRSSRRFAVRSSAVGEDSEELSAAGQNEARYTQYVLCRTPSKF